MAATRTHLSAQRRHQRRQNNICRGQDIVDNGKESRDSYHLLSIILTPSGRRSPRLSGYGVRRERMPKESCGRDQDEPGRAKEGPTAPE